MHTPTQHTSHLFKKMTTQELNEQVQHPIDQGGEGISLIDIVIAVGEDKWKIFWIAFVFTITGLGISLVMPNIYTAKTTFLPPQQNQSGAASALASLGGFAGLAGGALGIKSPDEMYVAFLHSETLQNDVIEQLKLQSLYEKKTLGDTRNFLRGKIRISIDKKAGLISIEADDKSPAMAAQLANVYVERLRKLLEHLAVTDAQQRRVFFEKLIAKTKETLSAAELASIKAQETSGIVSLDAQTTSAIKISAELRAQITLREVQIRAMSSYATSQNTDMQRLVAELAGLHKQLEKLEEGTSQNQSNSKSTDALANLRAFREVKYQEAVLEALIKQYELARIDEAKEGPLIQQLDSATPPEQKSKPIRSTIVIMATMLGLMFGLIVVFVRRGLRKIGADPVMVESFKTIRRAWCIQNQGK